MTNFVVRAGAWLAVVAVAGCLGNDVVKSGTLDIRITDAAVDGVGKVVLQFSGIDLHSDDGTQTFVYSRPKQIDMLQYTGGRFEVLLNPVEVPAGDYDWVRLRIDTAAAGDSYVELEDGSRHELTVTRSDNIGVRVNETFNVPKDENKSITLDLDLRKSLFESNGAYTLVPSIRLVDSDTAGRIRAFVDPEFFDEASCMDGGAFVYVFPGQGTSPTDLSGSALDPVTTVPVTKFSVEGSPDVYIGDAANLPEGWYTVAFTCDGEYDVPDSVEVLSFLAKQDALVIKNLATNIALEN
jgi:hypothetical protein